ncbi:hypothetical protein HOY82DRAFT_543379 [Tuber indicum]|nr:hypothetical protein HOY82DRAFT_543379 [Tuber indicum]
MVLPRNRCGRKLFVGNYGRNVAGRANINRVQGTSNELRRARVRRPPLRVAVPITLASVAISGADRVDLSGERGIPILEHSSPPSLGVPPPTEDPTSSTMDIHTGTLRSLARVHHRPLRGAASRPSHTTSLTPRPPNPRHTDNSANRWGQQS